MYYISKGKIGAIILGVLLLIGLISVSACIEKIPLCDEGVVDSMKGRVEKETLSQGGHLV